MVYATLIAVGDYKEIGATDIPTYMNDLVIMRQALKEGLRIPDENIRMIAGNDDRGKVSMKSLDDRSVSGHPEWRQWFLRGGLRI